MILRGFLTILLASLAALTCVAQSTKLEGTIFDPAGAVVPAAKVEARFEKGNVTSTISDSEGHFALRLKPGIYSLEVSRPGFVTIEIAEYQLVDAGAKGMTLDLVLFGSNAHEPCGYSGDCTELSRKRIVRRIRTSSSPRLKETRDLLVPNQKP